MDFVGWFPLGWILVDTMASFGATQGTLVWLAWLKMLTLVRVKEWSAARTGNGQQGAGNEDTDAGAVTG